MHAQLPNNRISELCKCDQIELIESIQSLWSGYGEIVRIRLLPQHQTAIVKYVAPPSQRDHKYGWSSDISHRRKLDSYDNELAWYSNGTRFCPVESRVAKLRAAEKFDNQWVIVLEDLNESGFPIRKSDVNEAQLENCLKWLAYFHATFAGNGNSRAKELELWPIGTYWHLATRPEELSAMPDGKLKSSADKIDNVLNNAQFQTVVHGDAKLANFCFSAADEVAAVDFQYVGGGCGIKDFAYFISSCLSETECEVREEELLKIYFRHLKDALNDQQFAQSVEEEWRYLYPFAWADFHRFLAGWSPGHWKIHRYTKRLTEKALSQL